MSRFSMNHSSIKFKLKDIMEEHNYSKNRLCRETGFRYETIQNYYNGSISRIDLVVVEEFCKIFQCNISDLFEYVPNKKKLEDKEEVTNL